MTVAVVSHDAGGAELLASYVCQESLSSLLVLEGPARAIFARRLGACPVVPLEEAIEECESVLCGSGWQSDLEFNAIRLARQVGKPSVAFLDHWTNYRERFVRSGEACLPDEIWVGDAMAHRLAIRVFPDTPIRLVENPYLLSVKRELTALPSSFRETTHHAAVLFVCEPVREHGRLQFDDERHWGYVEEDALRYFLENTSALGCDIERIVIRPHPSEAADKYAWAEAAFALPIVRGGTHSLLEEISDADVVVGCESMALVVALLAGKRVISCVPPEGRPCALPHEEIVHLKALIEGHPSR